MRLRKRWLFIAHRWMGIVLCLFMALWFVSGVVMMYVGYPKLTPLERLAHLPDLALPAACCVSPQRALDAAREKARTEPAVDARGMRDDAGQPEIKLAMIGARPHWLVTEGRRPQTAVDATTGEAATHFDAAHALDVSSRYAPGGTPRLVETVQQDIFTVSRALDPHRPLYLVALDDGEGTELYVSPRTGEVVRESTRMERAWNYLGSILHWLYPLKGELFNKWRADIIIYLSLAGTVLALAGIWVGVLRWRFSGRFASGTRSPYRGGWMRWHHLSGLAFGLVTLLWIFSGLMSMNPWKIFESRGPRPDVRAFSGLALDRAHFALTPEEAIARAGFPVRELSVRLFDGRPYYTLHAASGVTRAITADDADSPPFERFPEAALMAAAARLMPGHGVARATRLDQYDNYYYDRRPHTMGGHIERRLPVLRIEFDDPGHTWVHLDPYTAGIHSRSDDLGRVKRWLFNFLHSWDLRGFIDRRPLWDVSLILLSLGGFVLCISGTVIGWRRLRRDGRPAVPPAVVGAAPRRVVGRAQDSARPAAGFRADRGSVQPAEDANLSCRQQP